MTKQADWVKEFGKTKLLKMGGSCFECCDYEAIANDMQDFVKRQITLAQQRTKKKWAERLNAISDGMVGVTKDTSGKMREYLWYDDVQKAITDLLK